MANINGTSGNDNLTGGSENDEIDALGGNDRITSNDGDDRIQAGTGNDTIYSGAGNDTIGWHFGSDTTGLGSGDDIVFAGDGDDSVYPGSNNTAGGAGNDTIYGGAGNDYLNDGFNSTGNDRIYGGEGDDSIYGRLGDDFLSGGEGNDSIVDFNTGDDTVEGGIGNDEIGGAAGNDYLSGGGGEDTIYGGDGADTLRGQEDNDTMYGGAGDDRIDDITTGNDVIYGDAGNDTILSQKGDDLVYGGDGDDSINDWRIVDDSGDDTFYGGNGNDVLIGRAGEDTLFGDEGDDSIYGGADSDVMTGGAGNDNIFFGGGADIGYGGEDADTFTILNGAADGDRTISLYGGTDSSQEGDALDADKLVFEDMDNWTLVKGSLNQTNDADGNSVSGQVQLTDEDGNTLTIVFNEIEELNIVCFARGTMIDTEEGLRPVEALQIGDMVETKDNGLQPIRWIGSRGFGAEDLADNEKLYPVRIAAGALGEGYPVQDLIVSPQHRVLVKSRIAMRMFGEEEVLVAAKKLVLIDGIDYVTDIDEVEYFHFIFDQHEIVFSNGAETESLYTGPESIKVLSDEQREELLAVFPELLEMDYEVLETPVRTIVDGGVARKMAMRHAQNKADVFND